MTGREKFIVIVAGVSVLWGAVAWVRNPDRGRGTTGAASSQDVQAAARAFRQQAEARLDQVALAGRERAVLTLAQTAWEGDLFRKPAKPDPEDAEKSAASSHRPLWSYRYSGFAVVAETAYAVVDDRVYQEGELLEDETALVSSITPEFVRLVLRGDGNTVEIPLEGIGRERE